MRYHEIKIFFTILLLYYYFIIYNDINIYKIIDG